MRTVGAITIGQAPRDDVVPEMEKTAARSSWPSPPFRSPRPVLLPKRLIARFLGELA